MKIKDSLQQLDPNNDAHWTAKGLPQVAVVASLTGNLTLTRGELSDAAPGFDREAARRAQQPADQPIEPPTEPGDEADGITGDDITSFPSAQDEQPPVFIAHFAETKITTLAEAREQIALLRQFEAQKIQEIDAEIIALTTEEGPPHVVNQHAIMRWLASEAGKRLAGAERQHELILEKGVDPSELAGRMCPLDAAMARSTGYGHRRPNYPRPQFKAANDR